MADLARRSRSRSPLARGFGPPRGRDVSLHCDNQLPVLHAHSFVLLKHLGKPFEQHLLVAEESDGTGGVVEVALAGDSPSIWCRLLEAMYFYESLDLSLEASEERRRLQVEALFGDWGEEVDLERVLASVDAPSKILTLFQQMPWPDVLKMAKLFSKYEGGPRLQRPINKALGSGSIFTTWPKHYTAEVASFLLHAGMGEVVQEWFLRARCSLRKVIDRFLLYPDELLHGLACNVALHHVGFLMQRAEEYNEDGGQDFQRFWDAAVADGSFAMHVWHGPWKCDSCVELGCHFGQWAWRKEMPFVGERVEDMRSWLQTIVQTCCQYYDDHSNNHVYYRGLLLDILVDVPRWLLSEAARCSIETHFDPFDAESILSFDYSYCKFVTGTKPPLNMCLLTFQELIQTLAARAKRLLPCFVPACLTTEDARAKLARIAVCFLQEHPELSQAENRLDLHLDLAARAVAEIYKGAIAEEQ